MCRITTDRRGMTSVLAMLYMVLFSALAIGFYAATSTQTQLAYNEERVAMAQSAAESGMEYLRYQLARVSIPPNTAQTAVVNELAADLKAQIENTVNFGGNNVTLSGNAILIPENQASYIRLDGQTAFRAAITDWAGEIVVRVTGIHLTSGITRTITMDYSRQQRATRVFDYAVASRGRVVVSKGTVTGVTDPRIATVMSALTSDPSVAVSGGTIGGDLGYVEGGAVRVTGGNVAGTGSINEIYADHVHEVATPEFPVIDTGVYKPYATFAGADKHGNFKNVLIKAGTNPKFTGNTTIQGILYIESPNTVEFQGNVDLYGFIVFDNTNGPDQNKLDFSGNITLHPLPSSTEFDSLRATTGVAVLAPTAAMAMTGSSGSSNPGKPDKGSFLTGNIISATFSMTGAASLQIDRGSLITYANDRTATTIDGSKSIRFTETGKNNQPNIGLRYSSYFLPVPGSYQEVSQ